MTAQNLDVRLLRFRAQKPNEALPEDESLSLARDLLDAQRFRDAIEVLQRLRDNANFSSNRELMLAQAYLREGMFVEAQEIVTYLIKVMPDDAEPLVLLGDVLLKRGDPGRALKAFEKAIARSANAAELESRIAKAKRLAKIADNAAPPEKPLLRPGAIGAKPNVLKPAGAGKPDAFRPAAAKAPEAKSSDVKTGETNLPNKPGEIKAPAFRPAAKLGSDAPGDAAARGWVQMPKAVESDRERSRPPGAPGVAAASSKDQLSDVPPTREVIMPELASAGPRVKTSPGVSNKRETQDTFGDLEGAPTQVRALEGPLTRSAKRTDETRSFLDEASEKFASQNIPASFALPSDLPTEMLSEPPTAETVVDEDQVRYNVAMNQVNAAAPARPASFEQVEYAAALVEERSPKLRDEDTTNHVWLDNPKRETTKLFWPMAFVTVLVLGGIGYGGWYWWDWYQTRHVRYHALLASANKHYLVGGADQLTLAERDVVKARKLNPKDHEAVEALLRVRLLRLLEEGESSAQPIKPLAFALARLGGKTHYKSLSVALEALRQGRVGTTQAQCKRALNQMPLELAHFCARMAQLMGDDELFTALNTRSLRATKPLSAAYLASAEYSIDHQQYNLAREVLGQILQAYPNHPRATRWLELLAVLKGESVTLSAPSDKLRGVDAGLAWAAFLSHNTSNDPVALPKDIDILVMEPRTLARLADSLVDAGYALEASKLAAKAFNMTPASPAFRLLLARAYVAAGADDLGLKMLANAGGSEAAALRELAFLHLDDVVNLKLAAADAEGFLEKGASANDFLRSVHVRALLKLGNEASAARMLQVLHAQNKEGAADMSLKGWRLLAEADMAAHKSEWALAKKHLSEAADTNVWRSEVAMLSGYVNEQRGSHDEALVDYQRALKHAPWSASAALSLADVHQRLGHFDDAEKAYREAVQLATKNGGAESDLAIMARYRLAGALIAVGKLEGASEVAEQFGASDAQQAAHALISLRVAAQEGELERRFKESADVLRKASLPNDLMIDLAEVQTAAGRLGDAKDTLEKAGLRTKNDPRLWMGFALIDIKMNKAKDAVEKLKRAQSELNDAPHPALWQSHLDVLIARVHLGQKKPKTKDALESLKRAISAAQVDVEAYFWLGEVQSKSDAPAAREAYKKYLELAPKGAYAERANKALK